MVNTYNFYFDVIIIIFILFLTFLSVFPKNDLKHDEKEFVYSLSYYKLFSSFIRGELFKTKNA